MMQLPWQRRIEHSAWASGDRTREPILMKFGKQHQVWTTMTVAWSNIKIFNIQNGGRPPCGKIFEMPQLAYQWTKWDTTWVVAPHHVLDMSARCGCHGNGRCLATAHWTFRSYGRLETERVNQFWWNSVCNSKLGPQWQSWDQILKFLKYGGRSLLESIRNAITRLQMDRLGRNFGGRIPSCSQYWKCYNSSYDGTDWDDSWMVASKQHLCCKTVSLVFGRYC